MKNHKDTLLQQDPRSTRRCYHTYSRYNIHTYLYYLSGIQRSVFLEVNKWRHFQSNRIHSKEKIHIKLSLTLNLLTQRRKVVIAGRVSAWNSTVIVLQQEGNVGLHVNVVIVLINSNIFINKLLVNLMIWEIKLCNLF